MSSIETCFFLQLPPKPATLKDNASLGERIEYALWDKRHPDFEGAEAYVRYYLPENHQVRSGRSADKMNA